jgi:hypothetical protein
MVKRTIPTYFPATTLGTTASNVDIVAKFAQTLQTPYNMTMSKLHQNYQMECNCERLLRKPYFNACIDIPPHDQASKRLQVSSQCTTKMSAIDHSGPHISLHHIMTGKRLTKHLKENGNIHVSIVKSLLRVKVIVA